MPPEFKEKDFIKMPLRLGAHITVLGGCAKTMLPELYVSELWFSTCLKKQLWKQTIPVEDF